MRKSTSAAPSAEAAAEEEGCEEEEEGGTGIPANSYPHNKMSGTPPAAAVSSSAHMAAAAALGRHQPQHHIPLLAKKVCSALHEDILSLSGDAEKGLLPNFTDFSMSEESNLMYIVQKMRRECPTLCQDQQQLVFQLLDLLPTTTQE